MAEFTATPIKLPVVKLPADFDSEGANVVRPSNPLKQGVAGVSDIVTGIPMLLGMAGAGIEGGVNTAFGEGDQKFTDNFSKALSEGLDATLFKGGLAGREGMNKILNIEEPVSTEDQAARLAASLIPIPGLGAIAGASKLANAGRTAFNLATPAVRYTRTGSNTATPFLNKLLGQTTTKGTLLNKGNVTRIGTQFGIGAGIEQGVRNLADMPLMFSEEALSGVTGGTGDDEFTATPVVKMDSDIAEGNTVGIEKLKELDRKVQRQQDNEDSRKWAMIAAALVGVGAGAKYLAKHSAIPVKDMPKYVHERSMDKVGALTNTLKKMGANQKNIDRVAHNAHTDPIDIGVSFTQTGHLGQDFIPKDGKTAHAVDKLDASYIALGDDAKLFDDAMTAQAERATRLNKEGTLWRSARSTKELDEIVLAARANPKVDQLMKEFSETFDTLLDYQQHRGTFDSAGKVVKKMRENAMGPAIGGQPARLSYMPIYNKNPATFMQKLAKSFLGLNSKQGRHATILGEFGAKGINVSDEILTPLEALRRYSISTIAYANEQSFKAGILDTLSRVTRDMDGTITSLNPLGKNGKPVATGRDTKLIGIGTNLDDVDNIQIESLDDAFRSGSINDLKAGKRGDELVTVHQGGELRVYHVPDQGIRAALELNPKMSDGLQAMSHWKNMFTQGTTGKYSLFAPISHMFSSQQVAMNTAAREGVVAGIKSIGQSLNGTQQIMMINGAGDIARMLSKRIAKQIAEGYMPKQATINLQKRLERKFLDSTLNQVRVETGRTVTSLGNIGHGTLDEVMDAVGGPMAKFFSGEKMGLVNDLWNTWNNAWHEGPAYGAMVKHVGETIKAGKVVTPQVMRDAVDISKSVAGDMRRVGASQWATRFNASIPFASAMMQSWNSIGAAFKHDKGQFLLGVSALIGAPTMSELAYNTILSNASGTFPDPNTPGKEWTYADYYWNGYTTQQRTDNFIYFVPGQPPWEAILVPVSPEWGLFRAMTLEGADAAFGFSDVGNVKEAGQGREMFWSAVARVTDVPLPPPVTALASALGQDVRVGLANEYSDDPDNPGRGLSLFRSHALGGGERVTRRSGKARFAQGEIDTKTAAVIQDIFGAAGAAYINVYEGYKSGVRGPEGSFEQGVDRAVEGFGSSMKQQARYIQPLLGKAVRPNANDEIAKNLFTGRANLTRLSQEMQKGYIGAGIAYADGSPVMGNTVIPSDDPINLELAASAQAVDGNIGLLDEQITKLKRDISTAGLATNLGTTAERHTKIDSWTLEIQALKAQQLAVMHEFENELSNYLTDRYDRDITVDFTKHVPRSDLNSSSISKELRLSPQTSQ